jgi:predicted nucleic acid-binding protein
VSALVIDPSSWIAFLAQADEEDVIERALDEGTAYLPPIVAAEVLSGRMTDRARADLQALLLSLPLCQTDLEHWFRVGMLRRTLATAGLSVSTPDAHIAQCAIDLGADLLTRDVIFRQVARHTKLRLLT